MKIQIKGSGFTLLELLASVAIVAILAAITIAGFSQGNKTHKVVLGADLLVSSIRTAQTNSQNPQPLAQSTCSLGNIPAEYHIVLSTSTSTYTMQAYDKCNNAITLQTVQLPQGVQLKSDNGLLLDSNANGSGGGTLDIRFTPPFANMAASLNGGSFIPFNKATVYIESSDSQIAKNVSLDGISGKVETSSFVTSDIPVNNPPSATVPDAPTSLSATSSSGQIALSWGVPGSDGGSAVTGYNVYRGTSPGSETSLISLGNIGSYTDYTTPGTTYYYTVTAVNSVGESIASSEVSGTASALSWHTTTSYPNNVGITGKILVAYNGYMYIGAGFDDFCSGSGCTFPFYSSMYYAAIQADGSLGSWVSTTSLPKALGNSGAVANNGYLYATGGQTKSTAGQVSTVYYAPINANGSLGSWSTTTALTKAWSDHTATVHNGYMYLTPGPGDGNLCCSGNLSRTVYYAPINANGSLGAWVTSSNLLPSIPDGQNSAVAYNNYLYVDYNCLLTGSNCKITHASFNPDGSLSAWTDAGTGRTQISEMQFTHGNYMYMTGGTNAVTGSGTKNTTYSTFNPDGTTGSWLSTTPLPENINGGASAVYGNFVYVSNKGGLCCITVTRTMYYAPFRPDGTIGF